MRRLAEEMGTEERRGMFFERIVESFPGCVMQFDKDRKLLYGSCKVQEMFGFDPEKFLGSDFSDLQEQQLFPPEVTKEAERAGEPVWLCVKNQNGVEMSVSAVPVYDEEGMLEGICTFIQLQSLIDQFAEWVITEKEEAISVLSKNFMQDVSDSSIIACSPAMISLLQMARQLAPSTGTVMIYGESGSGKEVLAHFIHAHSNQKDNIFLPVNCAAIPENLAESELFGYESGAFTGAKKNGKPGYFELADGGTLFLDEIGELPLDLQAKLLRVLETRKVVRVGGSREIYVSVRILCATHRDLKEMVKTGAFREDLYYRLNILPLTIPPLRERKEDILPMAYMFLKDFNKKNNSDKTFSGELCSQMEQYDWPGNVRELRNVIERAVIVSPHRIIEAEVIFPASILPPAKVKETICAEEIVPLKEKMKTMESAYLKKVLDDLDWNVREAAQLLEIHPSGLYKKMKEYGLDKRER